ncbi:RcpC/CpaB family pilus assembly protein [Streptomyces halstedii]|uniref:RcpC/CpaB family pilus assembly protein n=1 Tax=Streptomyces halstedii TaxID=1944 RepID=UPI00334BABF4
MFPSVPDTRPAPPTPCGMPSFAPLRVRGGGRGRLRRVLRGQRRALAAGFALSSALLAVSGLGGPPPGGPGPAGEEGRAAVAGDARPVEPERRPVRLVAAPVRIADAATVRLLRPGDRVDVLSTRDADARSSDAGQDGTARARLVARDVRVAQVPGHADGSDAGLGDPDGGAEAGDGGLVVLTVERETAAALAGAGASGRLAVAVSHGH